MIVMAFNKKILLDLLKYEKLISELPGTKLEYYDEKKYYELEHQLRYIRDFIIWKQSFPKYLKLFTDFKNQLINDETFLDDFFDLYNESKSLLENKFSTDLVREFAYNSKDFEDLIVNPKSSGLIIFLDDLSLKLELLEDDMDRNVTNQETLHSYIKKIYPIIESFK